MVRGSCATGLRLLRFRAPADGPEVVFLDPRPDQTRAMPRRDDCGRGAELLRPLEGFEKDLGCRT